MNEEEKKYYDETLQQCKFYIDIQQWKTSKYIDYKGWLDNFNDDEKFIAAHILRFFTYISEEMFEHLLTVSVGKAGKIMQENFPTWKHENFKDACLFSYIPGENRSETDSGHVFASKLKNKLHIPENKILSFEELITNLSTIGHRTPVILVDDFIGTGSQCINAWNDKESGDSLSSLVERFAHVVVYSPVIINSLGKSRIGTDCENLSLTSAYEIGPEYNLFCKNCPCWEGNAKLYDDGVNLIIEKSLKVGIPDNNGKDSVAIKGFGNQGLAMAFGTSIPDAVPAFFYWEDHGWNPLIERPYKV